MYRIKAAYLYIFFAIFLAEIANAQEEKSPTVKYLYKKGYTFTDSITVNSRTKSLQKWPDSLFYNTYYHATLLGSPTIPISFSQIVLNKGKFVVVPAISIGGGYTWFIG